MNIKWTFLAAGVAVSAVAEPVTFQSLFNEMTDIGAQAEYPDRIRKITPNLDMRCYVFLSKCAVFSRFYIECCVNDCGFAVI